MRRVSAPCVSVTKPVTGPDFAPEATVVDTWSVPGTGTVAGAVTLLWSADPTLIGDIDRTEQLLIQAADPYTGSTSVGCFEGDVPNAAYGYGVLDVYEAVKEALGR